MGQKLSEKAAKRKREYIRGKNKEQYSQLNLRIPKELMENIKAATGEDISQRQFVIAALEEKLKRK